MSAITISDAEWQVMQVIWDKQPLAAQEIVEALSRQTDWTASTIKTMLHRLVKKDVLTFEAQGNRYVYRSRIRRSDCVRQESRSFLKRVFSGEPATLLAHFLKTSHLSPAQIADLRRILDEQEAQS
jgi:BlaI family transcriptional regulator, penicillinase repressor